MKTFSITDLTEQEVNTILGALGDMPFRVSAPLIQKLQTQLQPQAQANAPQTVSDSAQADTVAH